MHDLGRVNGVHGRGSPDSGRLGVLLLDRDGLQINLDAVVGELASEDGVVGRSLGGVA